MRSILFVYLTLLLSMIDYGNVNADKKKVCIIGAGMSGLVSVKRLAEHSDEFEPIAFERNSDVGGFWIYTESTTVDEHGSPVHSSAYKNLRTNVPKELMAWPDYRNFSGDERSSVPHYLVLQYLRNYTAHFNLRRYIRFNVLVESVAPTRGPHRHWNETKWVLKTRDLSTREHDHTICNAIMVCNGHLTKEYVPVVPGVEKFQGKAIHSRLYRKPEDFANETVAILGASDSGLDIAVDLSSRARKIYLSSRHERLASKLPSNIEQVPGIIKVSGDEMIMSNGSSITADSILFCTGYAYDFPFLEDSCGIGVSRGHVFPLYKQMINAEHPSMAVIGLPTVASIYLLPYVQVRLPAHDEMIRDAYTLTPGAPEGKYHALGAHQWAYHAELAKAAGFQLPPSYYEDGLNAYQTYRDAHPATFRELRFLLSADGTFRLENTEPDARHVSAAAAPS
ncbi:flavin-containing monooxygenase 5-like isoform X2 [Phymastichus coffea]|uniref:flavin-containing monooxygenase 5-like isoform X2 n=1 Tax=Phymastichus coffea TaxID=108790 RepID=UPI00273C67EC|nr:flavin-containing monooxygenase 5-like isoform X2 [Phymastichus coffea]